MRPPTVKDRSLGRKDGGKKKEVLGQRDRLEQEPGEGVPQCSKCDNNVCWCKDTRQPVIDTAGAPTSMIQKFRLSHSKGRLRVPAAPPPGPATQDG